MAMRRAPPHPLGARLDGLAGVLQHIGQRLGDKAASQSNRIGGRSGGNFEIDLRMGGTLQEHRLLHQLLRRVRRRMTGRGHARKGGELVDHAPDIAHLADDRIGDWLNTSGSLDTSFAYLRFRRSAESWIGVSGFLISCAMRRATSAQAAVRCCGNQIGDVIEGNDESPLRPRPPRSRPARSGCARSRRGAPSLRRSHGQAAPAARGG